MKVAYVSAHSADDRTALSGTHYSILKTLQAHNHTVTLVCPLRSSLQLTDRAFNLLGRNAFGYTCLPTHRWKNANSLARCASLSLKQIDADCIFSPSCLPIAALEDPRPKFIYSDATIPAMVGYYDGIFKSPTRRSLREACHVERCAFSKCSHIFMASEWARQSVIRHYDVPEYRVSVLPRGANVSLPITNPEYERACEQRLRGTVNILSVGKDWYRKGMDVTCDCVQILRARGHDARVTLVGATPPRNTQLPTHVTVVPSLSPNSKRDTNRLRELFLEATVFLLPTRAEAMGIVLAEAAAYALPAVSRATGGTSAAIECGTTGRLLPETAVAEDFALAIESIISSPSKYARMAAAARDRYRTTLNWESCCTTLASTMTESLNDLST